ncbi:unnamed protein product [Moneuplotes crassus]|uniref:Uncharacterized protein n=2 Tax=Euplotes crassus TaxID=5936 RepID=A0AAD1YDN5_EUPCR|nr:unnamed protein product [Moneuplotes crassus]
MSDQNLPINIEDLFLHELDIDPDDDKSLLEIAKKAYFDFMNEWQITYDKHHNFAGFYNYNSGKTTTNINSVVVKFCSKKYKKMVQEKRKELVQSMINEQKRGKRGSSNSPKNSSKQKSQKPSKEKDRDIYEAETRLNFKKLEKELKNDFKRQLDKAKNNLNLHTSSDKPNLNASMFLSIISQMLKSNYKLECDALEAHFDRKLSHEKDLLKSKFQVYTQQRISQEEELLEDQIRNERERITRTIEQEEKIEIDKQPIIKKIREDLTQKLQSQKKILNQKSELNKKFFNDERDSIEKRYADKTRKRIAEASEEVEYLVKNFREESKQALRARMEILKLTNDGKKESEGNRLRMKQIEIAKSNRLKLEEAAKKKERFVEQEAQGLISEYEYELKPSQERFSELKKDIEQQKELREVLYQNQCKSTKLKILREAVEAMDDENAALQKELRDIQLRASNSEQPYIPKELESINPKDLEQELIDKMEKLSVLEYKIEKLDMKNGNKKFKRKAGLEIKYGILDIKKIISQPKKDLKPLGSDIDVGIEDLEDLQQFFTREKETVEGKEKEIFKDKEVTDQLDKELVQRIEEISKATQEPSIGEGGSHRVYDKILGIKEQLELQKAKLGVEKNKIKLSETKFRNQRKACDKIFGLISEAKELDQRLSLPKQKEVDGSSHKEVRKKVVMRALKDELAYYIRNHKDLEYSLPDYLQNEPKIDSFIPQRALII